MSPLSVCLMTVPRNSEAQTFINVWASEGLSLAILI